MIEAKEALKIAYQNPSFERKTELYKAVTDRILDAAKAGEKSFKVSDEEHLALEAELKAKGYTRYPGASKGAFYVTVQIVSVLGGDHTYYFN